MSNGRREKWQPYTDANDWDDIAAPPPEAVYGSGGGAQDTSSVLLPMSSADGWRARVMQVGGSAPFILDMDNVAAGWVAAPRAMFDHPAPGDVNPLRINADVVILPTGEIFVEGGLKNGSNDTTGVRAPETYNPASGSWRVLPASPVVRGYHSTALLMPNGAVWVAGSNFNGNQYLGNRELRIEIFEPWYFCGRRPSISDAAPKACHGEEIEIKTPDAASIRRVVIVRCGTVTHNFNPDQRHITLDFKLDKGDVIAAQVPSEPNVVVVGWYLLFVIDGSGRPSTGRFIQICHGRRRPRWPWWDEAWWQRLREGLIAERPQALDELRRLQRDAVEVLHPPRRRPYSAEPHGPGDQGGGGGGHGGGHGGGGGPGGGGGGPGHGEPVVAPPPPGLPTPRNVAYAMQGDFLEVCDCYTICPCWTGRAPDDEVCTGVFAWVIASGAIDGVEVGGRTVVSVSTHSGHRREARQRVMLFVDQDSSDEQVLALAGAFSGMNGGPLGELSNLLGELLGVERAAIEVELGARQARLSVGTKVHAETTTLVGPGGEPTTLAGARLSSVLGTPAEVGESRRFKVALAPLGIQLDLQGRSAMRGRFSYRHGEGRH